ncbi:hypothetical protein [Allomuricauda sp. d1]|uniref:hypothetical protein n=1 Tax=Allomuricauda sp. d1 TaxID=3136725 RepID=UPI0031CF7BD9
MDKNTEDSLEKLFDTAFKDINLESPSPDFTEKVMHQIKAEKRVLNIEYRPIISKSILVGLFVLLVFIIAFFSTKADLTSSGWLDMPVAMDWTNKISFPEFSIPVSNTMLYGIVAFGFMLFIQITLLKGYLDKRLA